MAGVWLVLDGYEDEPAAFGVPNYIGFHARYICGVFEERGIEYRYSTIDDLRLRRRVAQRTGGDSLMPDAEDIEGVVILAGAVVPGKYVRGTPISRKEVDSILPSIPSGCPVLIGGWAVRIWRQDGWTPLRKNLFLSLQDTDATLDCFLTTGQWSHRRRTPEQWSRWAFRGASSRAVTDHPDIIAPNGGPGPLTYEVELYQGCVRYKRGCKFCIEPKKGVPLWRDEEDVIAEVESAVNAGIRNVRIGGATDVYTYKAEGVVELEYPIPNPEPIAKVLHEIRDDERIEVLHVDNANPSIIAENLEPSEQITKTLVNTLTDGAVLSFGLESADPAVHDANWLNCNTEQLMAAIRHVNEHGRERGPRGLPKLLPGLNLIAGLNGETEATYQMNLKLLRAILQEGLMLRRINIRQVEGVGFQEVPKKAFSAFKKEVRATIDTPMLERLLPVGTILRNVWWESSGDRIRLPEQVEDPSYRDESRHGRPGITFGRQIGAYPILVGVPYQIPLETMSDVLVTGHGSRSVSGVELGLDTMKATEAQFNSIPGIGNKTAWALVSARAKSLSKDMPIRSTEHLFNEAEAHLPDHAREILKHPTG